MSASSRTTSNANFLVRRAAGPRPPLSPQQRTYPAPNAAQSDTMLEVLFPLSRSPSGAREGTTRVRARKQLGALSNLLLPALRGVASGVSAKRPSRTPAGLPGLNPSTTGADTSQTALRSAIPKGATQPKKTARTPGVEVRGGPTKSGATVGDTARTCARSCHVAVRAVKRAPRVSAPRAASENEPGPERERVDTHEHAEHVPRDHRVHLQCLTGISRSFKSSISSCSAGNTRVVDPRFRALKGVLLRLSSTALQAEPGC
jgi:hypothetical protein